MEPISLPSVIRTLELDDGDSEGVQGSDELFALRSLDSDEDVRTPGDARGIDPREPILGREDELASLADFFDHAIVSGGALTVTGGSGMGKSVLVEEAARRAQSDYGAQMLHAEGSESEAEVSFAGIHQLMLPMTHTLDAVAEPHRSALRAALGIAPAETPSRILVTSALLMWLRLLAESAPLVVVFDGLERTDRASSTVLCMAARRLAGTRIAMVFTHVHGATPFIDNRARELQLGALAGPAADALLRNRDPSMHPVTRRRILTLADGNPLSIVDLARALTPKQRSGIEPLPDPLPMTIRLRESFSGRFAVLSQSVRDLLVLVAVDADAAVPSDLLARTTDADLSKAEETGLVYVDAVGTTLQFSHPLGRAAILELATASELRHAHARLAELCTDTAQRAIHRADAAFGRDDAIARELDSVARTVLANGDVARAVSVMVRAAELTSERKTRAKLFADAAYLKVQIEGNRADSRALLRKAQSAYSVASSTLEGVTAVAANLANNWQSIEPARRMLVLALESLDGDEDSRSIEAAATTLLYISAVSQRPEAWRTFIDVVERFASVLPVPLVLSATAADDPSRATWDQPRQLDTIVRDVDADADANPMRIVQIALIGHSIGRVPQFAMERVVQNARAGGAIGAGAICLLLFAKDAFFEGRWLDAERFATECVALAEENGLTTLRSGAVDLLMLLAAARGEQAHLNGLQVKSREQGHWRELLTIESTDYAEAMLAMGEGRYLDASREYAKTGDNSVISPHELSTWWTVLDVVEASIGSGRMGDARRHARDAVAMGLRGISPRLRFLCDAATASAAPDEDFVSEFESVLADPESLRWPFHLARVELSYGDRLRREREIRRARPHLERALRLFSNLGAVPWRDRAAVALEATGRTHHGIGVDWAELTPQEAQVASLAAIGLSNKQIGERMFLSSRTVSGHLYRLFPKLGITSRAALRDALTKRGIPD